MRSTNDFTYPKIYSPPFQFYHKNKENQGKFGGKKEKIYIYLPFVHKQFCSIILLESLYSSLYEHKGIFSTYRRIWNPGLETSQKRDQISLGSHPC